MLFVACDRQCSSRLSNRRESMRNDVFESFSNVSRRPAAYCERLRRFSMREKGAGPYVSGSLYGKRRIGRRRRTENQNLDDVGFRSTVRSFVAVRRVVKARRRRKGGVIWTHASRCVCLFGAFLNWNFAIFDTAPNQFDRVVHCGSIGRGPIVVRRFLAKRHDF